MQMKQVLVHTYRIRLHICLKKKFANEWAFKVHIHTLQHTCLTLTLFQDLLIPKQSTKEFQMTFADAGANSTVCFKWKNSATVCGRRSPLQVRLSWVRLGLGLSRLGWLTQVRLGQIQFQVRMGQAGLGQVDLGQVYFQVRMGYLGWVGLD